MSSIKVLVSMASVAVATPIVLGGLVVELQDASSTTPAVVRVSASTITTGEDGKATVEVQFDDVAVGDFSVRAYIEDPNGATITGYEVTATGNVPPPPPDVTLLVPQLVELSLLPAVSGG